jgi:hypothetical protein
VALNLKMDAVMRRPSSNCRRQHPKEADSKVLPDE